MQCCVPFCKFSENVLYTHGTDGKKITFHRFPSDLYLRAAWMRALGRQDIPLSEPAVVCSQHFLNEEMYETVNGLKQIKTGVIPSTVQVCMICLDTESRQFLMKKHKLVEAYEHLTGNPPCDLGNLKHTVCVHCAQSLRNFTRLREKSLKAEELMMDLVQQHQLITKQHIKRVNRAKHKLTNNMVSKILEPDHCDLHIVEEEQTESEESAVVKTENYDPMSEDEDVTQYQEFRVKVELDPLKCETTPFQCKICYEEFADEHTYTQHLTLHTKNGCGAGECGASPRTRIQPAQRPSDDPHELSDDPHDLSDDPHDLSDDPGPSGLSPNTSVAPSYGGISPNEANTARVSEEVGTINKNGTVLEIYYENHTAPEQKSFTCKICHSTFKTKTVLDKHIKAHYVEKSYGCQFCEYKSHNKSHFIMHMRAHTGDKRFWCTLCEYKSVQKSSLVTHMRTHTGEKPFTCKLCEHKFTRNVDLVTHMRTHTGEKPFSCTLCEYKCADKRNYGRHMRTHTGEKPYSCTLCDHRFADKRNLDRHMTTHTGEKPFSCELCDYKCVQNSHLVTHMRTHTGEKPFSCKFCEYKCSDRRNYGRHMRTHTGDKTLPCS